ncbi:hypothetical protein KAZ57_03475 [Patescibacteria group bacterium]|nr:hypothetical protein [Patescibacteria group bacterium]
MRSIKKPVFFLFVLTFLLSLNRVYADDSALNLTISPTFLQFETDPSVSKTTELKLRNNGTSPEALKITVGKFKIDSTGEKPELLDISENDETTAWLNIEQTEFVLEPQTWKSLRVTYSPPQGAALSYYYVIYLSRTNQNITPGTANVVGSPAILVLTTVNSPNARKELQLESFVAKNGFVEYLPQEFEVKIKNTGNVNVIPAGNIFVDSSATQDIAVLSINPTSKVVLPNSTRTFNVLWDDGFPLKTDKLIWNFENVAKFRLGRYSANALVVYDNGLRDVPIESTLSFWVFPITLMLVAIGVLMIPALITYIFMKILSKKRSAYVTKIHN